MSPNPTTGTAHRKIYRTETAREVTILSLDRTGVRWQIGIRQKAGGRSVCEGLRLIPFDPSSARSAVGTFESSDGSRKAAYPAIGRHQLQWRKGLGSDGQAQSVWFQPDVC